MIKQFILLLIAYNVMKSTTSQVVYHPHRRSLYRIIVMLILIASQHLSGCVVYVVTWTLLKEPIAIDVE